MIDVAGVDEGICDYSNIFGSGLCISAGTVQMSEVEGAVHIRIDVSLGIGVELQLYGSSTSTSSNHLSLRVLTSTPRVIKKECAQCFSRTLIHTHRLSNFSLMVAAIPELSIVIIY